MTLLETIVFILVGCLSGFMNTVASSGTAVTLPVMIFAGLDPLVANATNRLPVFVGFLTSVVNYSRSGQIPWKKSLLLAIPVGIGTAIGALFVGSLPKVYSELFVATALFVSLILVLMNPGKFLISKNLSVRKIDAPTILIMLIIGIWAGIIVLDSALFALFALVLFMNYELIKANAIKNVLILTVGLVSLCIFIYAGKVNWTIGILLSSGSIVGSYLGSNFAMKESSRIWVFRMIKLIITAEIVILMIRILPQLSNTI
jgi:uncharacterized membrane protein YfcA